MKHLMNNQRISQPIRISATLILAFASASTLVCTAQAAENEWRVSNKKVIEDYAIAGYTKLQTSSHSLSQQTSAFCANADNANFEEIKTSFHHTMDAWQQMQLLRLGPSELFMRHFRLEMWPDRSNTAAKQLRKLKQEKDKTALQVDNFRNASVAVQGLSAYERLVFAKDSDASQFTGEAGKYQCQLLQAISVSIETIAAELLKEWRGTYYKILTTAGKDNDTFANDKEVATVFINELSTQLQFVLEKKFKRPLDGKYFKGTRAESWRSGRSIRNIIINIESAQQVYQLGFKAHVADEGLLKKLQQQFKQAIDAGKALEMPLEQAYNEKADALEKWNQQVAALKNSVSIELPKAVDIVLGFNSLDGD